MPKWRRITYARGSRTKTSRVKSPPEKKRLRLTKDHRTLTLEDNKTFRSDWPIKKARNNRRVRRAATMALGNTTPDEMADTPQNAVLKPKRSLRKYGVMSLARSIAVRRHKSRFRWNFGILDKKFRRTRGRNRSQEDKIGAVRRTTFENPASSLQMSNTATITLWRPVGPAELKLIRDSDYQAFPPRLPEQPIFYPVLNVEYATLIARDWNVKADGAGYVTRFEVRRDFLEGYEVRQTGGRTHMKYWIPAEDLTAFNRAIVGHIKSPFENVMDG